MINVLILGANGFIGSNLYRYLLSQGNCKITLFSRHFSEDIKLLAKLHNNKIIEGQFQDYDLLKSALHSQDLVYHLISETYPATSWNQPIWEVENNLLPTLRFLDIAANQDVKKIAFISSGGTIYGNHDNRVDENHHTKPYIPHGIIKLCIEYFLNYQNTKTNTAYDIYRISNPYGPSQNKNGLGVISNWLRNIKNNNEILIFGDGNNIRDYIYIDDTVKLISWSTIKDLSHSDIYNVSSGTSTSLNELVNIISDTLNQKLRVKYLPQRKSDCPYSVLDNNKIMKFFPNHNMVSLSEGIRKTWLSINDTLFK